MATVTLDCCGSIMSPKSGDDADIRRILLVLLLLLLLSMPPKGACCWREERRDIGAELLLLGEGVGGANQGVVRKDSHDCGNM